VFDGCGLRTSWSPPFSIMIIFGHGLFFIYFYIPTSLLFSLFFFVVFFVVFKNP